MGSCRRVSLIILVLLPWLPSGRFLAVAAAKPQIESGFNMLYELKFGEARRQFADWQETNPRDPLGYEATAASYLFERTSEISIFIDQTGTSADGG